MDHVRDDERVVTRHFYRRRAEARERSLTRAMPGVRFRVAPAQRGPFRWFVVRQVKP